MKNKRGFAAVVICLLAVLAAAPWAFGLAGFDKNAESGEIRDLAKFPEKVTDSWFGDLETWFEDHSPLRKTLINLKNRGDRAAKNLYGNNISPILGVIFGDHVPDEPEPTPDGTPDVGELFGDPTPTLAPDQTPAPDDGCAHDYEVLRQQTVSFMHDGYTLKRCVKCGDTQLTDIVYRTSLKNFKAGWPTLSYSGAGFAGAHDWIFYAGDNSVGFFQGDNVLSEDEMKSWKNTLEELQKVCDKRGINLVVIACPNKEQVYSEYLPTGIDKSKKDSEKRESIFLEYMKANSKVKYLYPLAKLKTAKIMYETYLQQDTHWNTIGGFVGAMEVLNAVGLPTIGIQDLTVTEGVSSGGDLVSLTGLPSSQYTGYTTDYKPEVHIVGDTFYYNTVTGGSVSQELRVFESDAPTEHNAVIIGDSFRHAIGPYIAKNYKFTTVAHRGDWNTVSTQKRPQGQGDQNCNTAVIKESVANLKEGDLLLVLAVERYDSANIDMAYLLTDYLKKLK